MIACNAHPVAGTAPHLAPTPHYTGSAIVASHKSIFYILLTVGCIVYAQKPEYRNYLYAQEPDFGTLPLAIPWHGPSMSTATATTSALSQEIPRHDLDPNSELGTRHPGDGT